MIYFIFGVQNALRHTFPVMSNICDANVLEIFIQTGYTTTASVFLYIYKGFTFDQAIKYLRVFKPISKDHPNSMTMMKETANYLLKKRNFGQYLYTTCYQDSVT